LVRTRARGQGFGHRNDENAASESSFAKITVNAHAQIFRREREEGSGAVRLQMFTTLSSGSLDGKNSARFIVRPRLHADERTRTVYLTLAAMQVLVLPVREYDALDVFSF